MVSKTKSRFCHDSEASSSRMVVLSVVKKISTTLFFPFCGNCGNSHSSVSLLGDGDQCSEDGEGRVGPPEGRRFALCNVR